MMWDRSRIIVAAVAVIVAMAVTGGLLLTSGREPAAKPAADLYAHTGRLLEQARAATKAKDIGVRFGPAPASGRAVM
jgi:hypothetical protein